MCRRTSPSGPYITIGFTALMLLIPLAVTSTNKMMRRLGRRWQKLHRLVYLIAVLGVWHYCWQVKRDVRQPLVYVGFLVILLRWRLTWRWRTHGSKRRSGMRVHLQESAALLKPSHRRSNLPQLRKELSSSAFAR